MLTFVDSITWPELSNGWSDRTRVDAGLRDELRNLIDTTEPGKMVILPPPAAARGAMPRYADWLRPMAQSAAERGVRLLQVAGGAVASAQTLWQLCEMTENAAFGILIDTRLPMADSAAVIVPTLGLRIGAVWGAADGTDWVKKLRGIGSSAVVIGSNHGS